MSRSTSSTLRQAVFSQETSEVFLVLLKISHSSLGATPIRVVNNYEDISSGGYTYTAFPFDITLPTDSEDELPDVQLTIDAVDRTIIDTVRTLTGPATAEMSVILASSPGSVEAGPFEFTMRNVSWDVGTVTASLRSEDILNEPYPGPSFTPQNFPGLF